MKIGITPFVAENLAPTNAKKLSVYNGDTNVCDVDISKMKLPNIDTKLYSFGLLSDIHLSATTATENSANGTRFDTALTYFENQGCKLVCVCGDLTNVGFYTLQNDEFLPRNTQFAEYKRIKDSHSIPVYGCCGNHDSYYVPITENFADLEAYTGDGLYFTKTYGNDIFIFVGQDTATTPMSVEAFEWLKTTLETYKNNRCFLFIHPFVSEMDSGNPLGIYENKTFDYNNSAWGNARTAEFKQVLASYPNVILFHGHSHMRFENQFTVKNSNCSTALGFKSVHVPSTVYCRNISSGAIVNEEIAQGYTVDVYENHVVLKGYDFTESSFVPIAQYCIDTAVAEQEVYNIINNLTACATSNDVSTVEPNSSYSATISANSGYELSSVIVTMGGTDITASAVSGGNISIAEVTGDIVITAVAEEVEIVNQIPLSTDTDGTIYNGIGYKTNTRINSSGGAVTANGVSATGFIPAVIGNTVYLSGMYVQDSSGYTRIATYDSSKATINVNIYPSSWTNEGNDVYSYTITDSDCAYIRVSTYQTMDGDEIITINQPIV